MRHGRRELKMKQFFRCSKQYRSISMHYENGVKREKIDDWTSVLKFQEMLLYFFQARAFPCKRSSV